jgi:hypothetical protein
MNSFQNLVTANPDFMMLLAIDFLSHMDSAINTTFVPTTSSLLNSSNVVSDLVENANNNIGIGNTLDNTASAANSLISSDQKEGSSAISVDISPPVQSGIDLLNRVLRICPGIIPGYVGLQI